MRKNKVFNRYKRMSRKLPCRICVDLYTDRIDPAVDLERGGYIRYSHLSLEHLQSSVNTLGTKFADERKSTILEQTKG